MDKIATYLIVISTLFSIAYLTFKFFDETEPPTKVEEIQIDTVFVHDTITVYETKYRTRYVEKKMDKSNVPEDIQILNKVVQYNNLSKQEQLKLKSEIQETAFITLGKEHYVNEYLLLYLKYVYNTKGEKEYKKLVFY